MTGYKETKHRNKYNECPICGHLKRKESKACRNCYAHVSPFKYKQAIIESFGKLFK